LCDVAGLKLPAFLIARFIATEFSVNRPGHDVADFDAVVPDFLHERFAETVQAKFRGVVSGHLCMRVGAG
jgi:hypothetical protein